MGNCKNKEFELKGNERIKRRDEIESLLNKQKITYCEKCRIELKYTTESIYYLCLRCK